MTAPAAHKVSFHGDSSQELLDDIARFMRAKGFRVEREEAEMISFAALCSLVGRPKPSVSKSLRRASCPKFEAVISYGSIRRRTIKVRPTEKLIDFLRNDL